MEYFDHIFNKRLKSEEYRLIFGKKLPSAPVLRLRSATIVSARETIIFGKPRKGTPYISRSTKAKRAIN